MTLSSSLTAYFLKKNKPKNLNQLYVGNKPMGFIGKYTFQFMIYETICWQDYFFFTKMYLSTLFSLQERLLDMELSERWYKHLPSELGNHQRAE